MSQAKSRIGGGFTLLELLVVVAVIALLLAILLPALSAASEAGRSIVCGNNMNQIGIGSYSYSEANDFWLPWTAFASRRPANEEWWVTQVARGMDDFEPDIYSCPSDPVPYQIPVYYYNGMAYMNDGRKYTGEGSNPLTNSPNDAPLRADHAGGRPFWVKVTYRGTCDLTVSLGGWNTGPDGIRRVTEFAKPHKAIHMVEGIQTNQYGINPLTMQECMSFTALAGILKGRTNYVSWSRHFGISNLLFIDGHVESLPPMDVADLAVNWKRNMMGEFRYNYRRGPGLTKLPGT